MQLGFPLQAFVAGAVDHYRKPHTTMWDDFVSNYNGGISIDMDNSFYCGDAAGRPKNWKAGAPRDFSCTDRKFAANIGLKFYTPEELFLNEQPYPDFDWDSIDPVKTLKEYENGMCNPILNSMLKLSYLYLVKQQSSMTLKLWEKDRKWLFLLLALHQGKALYPNAISFLLDMKL